jgi:hypothetical protein
MMDNRWRDTASDRDIERVHEAATAWKDHDTAARRAAVTIRDQVQRRYGLDVNNLGADNASAATALAKAERDREQAEQERRAGREENAQEAQLLAEADREDRARQQSTDEENAPPEALREEAGIKSDSAERRRIRLWCLTTGRESILHMADAFEPIFPCRSIGRLTICLKFYVPEESNQIITGPACVLPQEFGHDVEGLARAEEFFWLPFIWG